MGDEVRVGVYICHCGTNIAGFVRMEELVEFAKTLPNVVVVRDYKYMCSDTGQNLIAQDAKEHKINRVVVAACSPRLHEETYKKAMVNAGLNPFMMEMANIREHDTWVHPDMDTATQKAKDLIKAAVKRVSLLEPLEMRYKDVVKSVLVIGGGIAGIQAALDIAEAGYQVFLVEREPSIGGHMIQLDKTFPTLDCSACIQTPKMFDCGRHPNIKLLTYSEVEKVSGSAGNFIVTIRRKPRFVNEDKCIGCLQCVDKCPTKVEDEYNYGLSQRKAIYLQFPQATPKVPVIDSENCRYIKEGKCGVCAKICPADAINYDDKDDTLEINIGFIIVATGYDLIDLGSLPQYGWGRYENVLHSLQFERLLNAAGPTGGKILLKDGSQPKSVAILHCIGSRDQNHAPYCSRVCCMYALKFAHLFRERCGEDAQVYNFYIDMRCFGKGYEEFYKRISEEGVHFIRGKVARILPAKEVGDPEIPENQLVVESEDTLSNKLLRVGVDMVVLCPAMVPSKGTEQLTRILKVNRSEDGFILERHPKLDPLATLTDGIYVCGCAQGPKDIPDTVAQASGAAAKVVSILNSGKIAISPIIAHIEEEKCTGCRVCNSVCPFDAIDFKEEESISVVEEALCKGCGVCVAACPFGAIKMRHFTDTQIRAQIEGVLL